MVSVLNKICPFLANGLADDLVFPAHALLDDVIELWMHDGLDNVRLEGGFILLESSVFDEHSFEHGLILLQLMKLANTFPVSDPDWVLTQRGAGLFDWRDGGAGH